MSSSAKYLLGAFEQRNIGKFQEALEVFQMDPNDIDDITNRTVFETILREPGSTEFIKVCLQNDADFYMKNNIINEYPLHCVIESECLENLTQIASHLEDGKLCSYVNVKIDHGRNSLHILADKLTNDNFDNIFDMMKILVTYKCNANYPNYDGKTAFFIILEKIPKLKKRKDILEYFLKHANIDFYSHRSDETIEMVMNQKLKYELPEKEEVNIDFESMVKLLVDSNEINKFETLFPFFKAACEDTESYQDSCSFFMEIAVKKSIISIVDLLIDYSIDVNRIAQSSQLKVPPAFLSCSDAKPAIFRLFLMHPKIKLTYEDDNKKRKTLLHQFFQEQRTRSYSSFRRSDCREMTKDQKKCFDLIMAHQKCNRHLINAVNEDSLTAIYYAVKFKNDYVTLQLLKNGAYIGNVMSGIRKSLLEEFLNSTITSNGRFHDDEELEIRIDYTFLSPPCNYHTSKKKAIKKNIKFQQTEIDIPKQDENVKILSCESHEQYSEEIKPLQRLADNAELHSLLAHPTIASFILLKWNKISFLVYVNMIIILSFLLSFITFAYLCQNLPDHEKSSNVAYIFFQVISLISLSCLIIRELTQVMLSVKKYLMSYKNWIDICLMAFALTILGFERDIPNHVSRLLRTFVILLATAEYFSLLGMVPILSISIHTKIFHKICGTFMKSLAFYSMLIIAFAFSFYNLQGDKFDKDNVKFFTQGRDTSTNDIPVTNSTRNERFNNFYTVGSSIIKSFVMLTGELETSYIHTEGWTYSILFLAFLFLVTIVLYNLLNAMAVSDTQEIKRDAKLIDLNQRIVTMHDSEHAIFKRNSRAGNWLKMVISMFPKTISEGFIIVKPNLNLTICVKKNERIILNEWLPDRLQFLKQDVTFNSEIMKDIQILLKSQRENEKLSGIRRLKDSRNEKLANDIINLTEMMGDIQKNIARLQSDLFSIQKRINL